MKIVIFIDFPSLYIQPFNPHGAQQALVHTAFQFGSPSEEGW